MNCIIKCIGIVSLVLCSLIAEGKAAKYIAFKTYNVENGLSQSSVYCSAEDSRGFRWIGTGDGLNRLAAGQIDNFFSQNNQPGSINDNTIRRICPAKNGVVWVGTDKGISRFNPDDESFTNFPLSERCGLFLYIPLKVSENEVTGVCEDMAVFSFNFKSGKLKIFHMQTVKNAGSVKKAFYFSNNIWFADKYGKLGRFDLSKKYFTVYSNFQYNEFSGSSGKRMYITNNQAVWQLELARNNLKVKAIYRASAGKTVQDAGVSINRLWLVESDNKLKLYLYKDKEWIYPAENIGEEVLNLNVRVSTDKEENLWIETDGNGILKCRLQSEYLQNFSTTQTAGLHKDFIKAVTTDYKNNVFAGTLDYGLYTCTSESEQFSSVSMPQQLGKQVNCLIFNYDSALWAGTENGIYRKYISGVSDTLMTGPVRQFIKHRGTIWCRDLYQIFKFDTKTSRQIRVLKFRNNLKYFTFLDSARLFASFSAGGFLVYNFSKHSIEIRNKEFNQFKILMLSEMNNKYYLATNQGIIITAKSFNFINQLNRNDGLPDHFVYCLLNDHKGNLWGSTNNGLFRYSPQNNFVKKIGKSDGLQNLEFNSNSWHTDIAGNMYFGGINGLVKLLPSVYKADTIPAKVWLKGMEVNDKKHSPGKNFNKFKPDENTFKFKFLVSGNDDYSQPQLLIKINGINGGWQNMTVNRTLNLEALPPGNYKLLAQTMNADGFKGPVTLLSVFTIARPFWSNPINIALFTLLAVLLVGTIVFSILRYRHNLNIARLQREQEKENIRKHIYRDLHDEIGAGLSRIKLISGMVQMKPEVKPEDLSQMSNSIDEVTGKLREIVWGMNSSNEWLHKMVQKMQSIAEEMLFDSEIQSRFDIDVSFPEISLQPEFIRNNIMVFREALNNAVKHAAAGRITIKISLLPDNLFFWQINDDGKGFIRSQISKDSNGLEIMQQRMDEVGASLVITSTMGNGTTVEVQKKLL